MDPAKVANSSELCLPPRPVIELSGVVVAGTGGASGQRALSDLGGTLALQLPHFIAGGLDLSSYYRGTINLDLGALELKIRNPDFLFRDVCWHDAYPPETFSFKRCTIAARGQYHDAYIYHPHPETKPSPFAGYHIVEIISDHISGLKYGDTIAISIPSAGVEVMSK